jgi:hypothetical protein
MLTPSGFRQHYLIGHELRKRYVNEDGINDDKILSPVYRPSEVYVRSTQVHRTVQSVNAQLLGLYPLSTAPKITPEQVNNSLPPIKVSDQDQILEKLGLSAVELDFQPIPTHNFEQYTSDETLGYGGCPFLVNDYLNRSKDPEVWRELDIYYKPLIYDQIAQAFNKTPEEIKFIDMYQYTDVLFAEEFEGILNRYKFSDKEWDIVRSMQLPLLVELLSDLGNEIISLRYIFPIIEQMKAKIGVKHNTTMVEEFGDAKFTIFSSHDYHMSHILKFMNASNLKINHIEYASLMLFELHQYDRPACEHSKAKNCHYVRTYYNDVLLEFPGCSDLDCPFDEFEKYIESIGMPYEKVYEICHSEEPLEDLNFEKDELLQILTSA